MARHGIAGHGLSVPLMRMMWVDVPMPGLGLLAQGYTVVGGLIFAGGAGGILVAAAAAIIAPERPWPWRAVGALAWLLAVVAVVVVRWITRERQLDQVAVRASHRACCAAFLRGELPAATAHAQHLCRLAATDPGAWRLRAVVAAAGGQPTTTFIHRAEALEQRP